MNNQNTTSCPIFFVVLFLIVFSIQVLFSQDKESNINWLNEYYPRINLNADIQPLDLTEKYQIEGLEFKQGKGHTFSQVWGRGWESKGVYPKELLPPLFSRKIVFDKLDSKTVSRYGYLLVTSPSSLNSELCINNSKFQHDSYHLALTMGQLYHKNLALMDAKVIMYCWMLLNGPQPSFDATRSLFKVSLENDSRPIPSSNQLRVFGALAST